MTFSHARCLSWGGAVLLLAVMVAGCDRDPVGSNGAPDACTDLWACEERLEVAPGAHVRYMRTFRLQEGHPSARRALILVHGQDHHLRWQFHVAQVATREAGVSDETVVVAPLFQSDPARRESDAELFWPGGPETAWKRGHLSSPDGPTPRISSFEVMDHLVRALSNRDAFPRLDEIVVAGFSAGGQLTHRYASGSPVEDEEADIRIRYVVASPSTFLFPGPERPQGEGFAIPDVDLCPDYNHWHWGVERRNPYMSRLSEEAVVANLLSRSVHIVVGDLDTGSALLDVRCGANLQGAHRYERGINLMAYLDARFPGHQHSFAPAPGVDHSDWCTFLSDAGLRALFDFQPRASDQLESGCRRPPSWE